MTTKSVRLEILDEEHDEFAAYARGRRVVVDFWEGMFGCGGIASGNVFLRWESPASTSDDNRIPVTGLEPVEAWVRSEIAELIGGGVFRVAIRGRGPFRKPILLLVKHRAWLEHLGNVPLGA